MLTSGKLCWTSQLCATPARGFISTYSLQLERSCYLQDMDKGVETHGDWVSSQRLKVLRLESEGARLEPWQCQAPQHWALNAGQFDTCQVPRNTPEEKQVPQSPKFPNERGQARSKNSFSMCLEGRAFPRPWSMCEEAWPKMCGAPQPLGTHWTQ